MHLALSYSLYMFFLIPPLVMNLYRDFVVKALYLSSSHTTSSLPQAHKVRDPIIILKTIRDQDLLVPAYIKESGLFSFQWNPQARYLSEKCALSIIENVHGTPFKKMFNFVKLFPKLGSPFCFRQENVVVSHILGFDKFIPSVIRWDHYSEGRSSMEAQQRYGGCRYKIEVVDSWNMNKQKHRLDDDVQEKGHLKICPIWVGMLGHRGDQSLSKSVKVSMFGLLMGSILKWDLY